MFNEAFFKLKKWNTVFYQESQILGEKEEKDKSMSFLRKVESEHFSWTGSHRRSWFSEPLSTTARWGHVWAVRSWGRSGLSAYNPYGGLLSFPNLTSPPFTFMPSYPISYILNSTYQLLKLSGLFTSPPLPSNVKIHQNGDIVTISVISVFYLLARACGICRMTERTNEWTNKWTFEQNKSYYLAYAVTQARPTVDG